MSPEAAAPPSARPRPYPSRCIQCGGEVVERRITLVYGGRDDEPRVVRGVPAGVCATCGERYMRPEVAEAIEGLLEQPPARREDVPAWDYAATA